MPYNKNSDLPDRVKNNLSTHGQDAYRKAFNNALKEYQDPSKRRGNESAEVVAHKVAWTAAKSAEEKQKK